MPKIDLTGRVNGDFIVIGEYEPVYDAKGKKKLRWLCECQTCKEREVVLGESIRRSQHRFCSYCLNERHASDGILEDNVSALNKSFEKRGFAPITKTQLIKAYKYIEGVLPKEDEKHIPEFMLDMIKTML